jgi:isochorismate hydrolase
LVLDMQCYFLEEDSHAFVPSAPAILPGVLKLGEAFRAHGRPVVLTRHVNSPEDAGQMARWWRDLLSRENPLSELIPELKPDGGLIIEKGQYDAFHNTDLEGLLKEHGVEQLVICGVMTHLCCETTARAAFVRGFEVFFTVDGTATYNEAFHRASLLNLAHGFAHPVLIEELLESLGKDGCES